MKGGLCSPYMLFTLRIKKIMLRQLRKLLPHRDHKKNTNTPQQITNNKSKKDRVFCEIDSGRPSEINLDKSFQIYQNRFFQADQMRKTQSLEQAIANFLYFHNESQLLTKFHFNLKTSSELLKTIEKKIKSGAEINKKPYGFSVLANYNSFLHGNLHGNTEEYKKTISAQYFKLITMLIKHGIDLNQKTPAQISLNMKLKLENSHCYRSYNDSRSTIQESIENTFSSEERNLTYIEFIEKVFKKDNPKTELLDLLESANAKPRIENK